MTVAELIKQLDHFASDQEVYLWANKRDDPDPDIVVEVLDSNSGEREGWIVLW